MLGDQRPGSRQGGSTAHSTAARRIVQVLLGFTDKQNTYCAKAVLAMDELPAELRQQGQQRAAVALEAWGAAALGMGMPGLSCSQRSLAVHSRTVMASRMLGDWLFVPQAIPQQLGGVSSNILLSQLMNAGGLCNSSVRVGMWGKRNIHVVAAC